MPTRSSDVAAALVSRFQRQRPVRGGSLLVTIFGDAIAPRGGAITLQSLIGLAEPFGLKHRLVRTAINRLAYEGWFRCRRSGRLSEFHLSREGGERFADATRQIYGLPPQAWSRTWTLVVLPRHVRGVREIARAEFAWAGFGELSPELFVHPTMALADAQRLVHRTPALADAIVMTTAQNSVETDRQLAALGWDLAELIERYSRFIATFEPVLAALRARKRPAPESCFVIRTLVINQYRKIHLRDPLLPSTLLPADWVGSEAYALCRAIYERAVVPAEDYLSGNAVTFNGPLPAAGAALMGRFGGLRL